MASYRKKLLSASTNGRAINVVASGTPGTLLHTAVNDAVLSDEVWLWANNITTLERDVTIEFGGTASGDLIRVAIPKQQGLHQLVPGLVVSGGVAVRAFTEATAVSGINVFGYVNELSQ